MPSKRKTPRLERIEGSPGIYKRGNRFVAIYTDLNGKQRKVFAATKKAAVTARAERVTDVARGDFQELTKVSFVDYAAEWISTYKGRTSRGVREATRADYRRRLGLDDDCHPITDEQGRCTNVGAVGYFGRARLAEVRPPHIKRYAAKLAENGLAPNTVRLHLAPVRAMFATAFEDGLIRTNPCANVRIAKPADADEDAEAEKVKAMTEDELRGVLDAIQCVPCQSLDSPEPECTACTYWRLFFELLAHTGLRIGELVALQWEHVELGRRRLLVRRRFYKGTFAPPKSRYGRRDVPLAEGMAKRLWRLRGTAGDEDLVFASGRGTIVDQQNIARRILKPAARKAGFPWVSYHSFRHTCGTMLFRRGLNAKQVQGWLGHHSPAFTLAVYVHLLPDDLPTVDFLDDMTGEQVGNTGAVQHDATARNDEDGEDLESGSTSRSVSPGLTVAASF